jgi:pimeloyl-ACP methyl ester carboxylesterase
MAEKEIKFCSGGIELAGTIALPDSGGPFPAVILIAGSGPIDRNENHKKMRINAFYDISQYLAKNGIASLRYDKRGVGSSGGDYHTTGFNDHAADARAALQFFKTEKNILPERIFLIGHSEGAFISCKLAGGGIDAAGIILLAGGAQSGEAVLKWQAVKIAAGLKGFNGWLVKTFHIDVLKAQKRHIDKIKDEKKPNSIWLREFMAYDPSEDLRKITVPVLAITGSKDIQVDPADMGRMAEMVKGPFEQHLINNMTHMLRLQEGKASISNYKDEVKKPVEQELMVIVLHWIKSITVKRRDDL